MDRRRYVVIEGRDHFVLTTYELWVGKSDLRNGSDFRHKVTLGQAAAFRWASTTGIVWEGLGGRS